MVLIAKIKGKKRHEIRKWLIGKKENFEYNGCTYHIRPDAIYNYTVFGFITNKGIDYVQGNGEPINYFQEHLGKDPTNKNLDKIGMLIGRWLQGRFLHFQLMVLIMLGITIGINAFIAAKVFGVI